MMKKTQWLLTFLFLLTAVPIIVFAGGQTDNSADSMDSATKPVTVTVWDYVGPQAYQDAQDEIIADYMAQNPGVTIKLTRTPFSEHLKKLSVALASGRGPDIYHATEVITYVDAEFAAPLPEKYYDVAWNNIYPQWKSDASVDGIPYCTFISGGPRVLFYNDKMLKDAGFSKPPATWEEIREYAKRLVKYDENGEIDICGINLTQAVGPAYVTAFAPFLLSNGGVWVDDASGNVRINESPGVEALQLWTDLVIKDKVASMTFPPDSIYLGKSAMRLDYSGNIVFVSEKAVPEIAEHIKMAPIPPPRKGDTFIAQAAPWKVMVNTNSKYQDAAWNFSVFQAREYNLKYSASQGSPVLYKDIADEMIAKYKAEGNMDLVAILEIAETAKSRPLYWRSFATRLGVWIEKALLGEVTAQEALDNAKAEIEAVISEGGAM